MSTRVEIRRAVKFFSIEQYFTIYPAKNRETLLLNVSVIQNDN